METQLLHIFRNTPLGRETLFQSAYFCRILGLTPVIYIPKYDKFLMYFENDVVQVDLDGSYLRSTGTARAHVESIIADMGASEPKFIEPKHYTASNLPDIPTHFDYMACPRSISDLSTRIGLGYIGPKVRRIVKNAKFPVLIPSMVFKQWRSILVFFGGSENAGRAMRLGLHLSRKSGLPLMVFTQAERKNDQEAYISKLKDKGLWQDFNRQVSNWYFFDSNTLEENLYEVPHDSLVIIGAYGHGLVRELLFGSFMEKVQSELPNSLLIVGPHYRAPIG